MVTVSSLEKIPKAGKLSDCLAISQSSGVSDQKPDLVGEDHGNINITANETLSRSVTQNHNPRSDMYLGSTYCKVDRQLVGVIGGQNESSLFSSSLSDLANHKLRLASNNLVHRQLATNTSQKDDAGHIQSREEAEGHSINNLPDEEELFSGMVDEMEPMGRATGSDDLEDFDVFTYSGGIELESDDHSMVGQRNVGYPWGLDPKQHSVPTVDHGSRALPMMRSPNAIGLRDSSPLESSRIHANFQSSVRFPSIGSDFPNKASRPFSQVQMDNRGIPSFHPRSPQMQLSSPVNVIPQNSFDNLRGIGGEIHPTVSEKLSFDLHYLGLNGPSMEHNEGAFGYSPSGIHTHQSLASKSSSYQQHHLRSLLMSNSPSFMNNINNNNNNNNHAHHLGGFPGSPGAQHLMMNMMSPAHQLQVGSAPVMKASLWDRQQVYSGESHEASSGYQMGGIRGSVGIPRFSASHAREMSSIGGFPQVNSAAAEISKNSGIHSPKPISHIFQHERNSLNSMPIAAYGSPNERVRNRRNESHLSQVDKKHYELNIDRILQGDDSRTTLMLKNIPNKYTSKMLLATIDEQHRGKYDFIYLPIDFKNKCNMGYAFINMIDPVQIVTFHQTFQGRKWEKFNSEKVASLAYARIQGKTALIAHFQNSSLMNEDKRCRPILFHTDGPNAGDQEPFPVGTTVRPKQGRSQVTDDNEDE